MLCSMVFKKSMKMNGLTMNEYQVVVLIKIYAENYSDFEEAMQSKDWDDMEIVSITEPEIK